MVLNNFKFSDDNIAIEQNGSYYDLHNCFAFTNLNYDVANRELLLGWEKRDADWVPENSPEKILMAFSKVSLFKTRERDKETPCSEDDCLNVMGFIWNSMVDDMSGFYSNEVQENCTHFILEFMGGFSIKVEAEEISIKVLNHA